jgi:hypothetical protein
MPYINGIFGKKTVGRGLSLTTGRLENNRRGIDGRRING